MILSNLATGLKQRDWGTVAVEVLIVVVGIFIGLQVNDWNQARIDRADIAEYMERVQGDLNRDADFFAFLANKASAKREALATLKKIIARNRSSDEDAESIFGLLSDSVPMGFEFPEVQTVTFLDLRGSGKLTLIEDAELRRQLSFYYQESVHRSDRVESRITGYAAAVYQMLDPRTRLVGRDSELHYEPPDGDNEDFDLQAAAAAKKTADSQLPDGRAPSSAPAALSQSPQPVHPGPRTTRPGVAPVCSPSLSTCTPFTITCSTPLEY